MNIEQNTLRRLGIFIIILHALVFTPHSIAHTNLYIAMNTWQNIYIFLVILVGPIVSAILLWQRNAVAFIVLAVSMAGAFVFGFYYHFLGISSDNVFTLPAGPWTMTFQLTAWLLALTEIAGAVVGLLGTANR
jgi:hypothetical protein